MTKNYFMLTLCTTLLSMIPLDGYTIDRNLVVPPVSTIGYYQYSTIQITQSGPPNATITLFQAPGVSCYHCLMPSTTTDMTICVSLNNRFAPRFSNHHHASAILCVVMQHLATLYSTTTWISYLTTPATSYTKFTFTHTSSGPCLQVNGPTTSFSLIMAALRKMVKDIYATTMTNTNFDDACTKLTSDITTALTSASLSSNSSILQQALLRPKWDCAMPFGTTLSTLFGVPIGSCESYSSKKYTAMSGIKTSRESGKLALSTLKSERNFTIFISTGDTTVVSQIPAEMKNWSYDLSPTYTKAFNSQYYGYILPKGLKQEIIRATGTGNAVGCIIYFGPISPESLLAAAMTIKLINDGTITSGFSAASISAALIPVAGQSTVRIFSTSIPSPTTTTWRSAVGSFLTALQSRYASGANSADFSNTNYLNLISAVQNNFLPVSRTNITGDQSNISSVFTGVTETYAWWMQIFQGSIGIAKDLNTYKVGTTATQTALLQRAAALITAQSTTTISSEIDYLLA